MRGDPSEAATGPGPGAVAIRIGDPDAVLAFYGDLLGLAAVEQEGEERGTWRLTAPEDPGRSIPADPAEALVVLEHAPEAPARPARAAGLFHVAFLVPSRAALARTFLRLRRAHPDLAGGSFQGASDHGVSRALYLTDPEGNGVEIYHDRARRAWPSGDDGGLAMFTRPLDLDGLLQGVEDDDAPLPAGTSVGHVHLRTADLATAEAFWHDETGMDVTVRSYPGARFLAHGDYHHHLGLNTWGGPLVPAPDGARGLARLEWRVEPGTSDAPSRRVRTADGLEVVLRAR